MRPAVLEITRALIRWAALPALLVVSVTGVAYSDDDQDTARRLREAGEILPLETIIGSARNEFPGRVLEVELEEEDGGFVYELELLDESGVVHELRYDARSGRRIEASGDD